MDVIAEAVAANWRDLSQEDVGVEVVADAGALRVDCLAGRLRGLVAEES